jgi:hypothetical protein
MLSVVERLELSYYSYDDDDGPPEWYEVDPTQWRELLRPFRNLKTLSVDDELVGELSHSLRLADEESSPERLLPKLRELRYVGGDRGGDAFAPFIHTRQTAGQSVDLVRDCD